MVGLKYKCENMVDESLPSSQDFDSTVWVQVLNVGASATTPEFLQSAQLGMATERAKACVDPATLFRKSSYYSAWAQNFSFLKLPLSYGGKTNGNQLVREEMGKMGSLRIPFGHVKKLLNQQMAKKCVPILPSKGESEKRAQD